MAESWGGAIGAGAMAGFTIGMVNLITKVFTGTGWVDEGVKIALGFGGGK